MNEGFLGFRVSGFQILGHGMLRSSRPSVPSLFFFLVEMAVALLVNARGLDPRGGGAAGGCWLLLAVLMLLCCVGAHARRHRGGSVQAVDILILWLSARRAWFGTRSFLPCGGLNLPSCRAESWHGSTQGLLPPCRGAVDHKGRARARLMLVETYLGLEVYARYVDGVPPGNDLTKSAGRCAVDIGCWTVACGTYQPRGLVLAQIAQHVVLDVVLAAVYAVLYEVVVLRTLDRTVTVVLCVCYAPPCWVVLCCILFVVLLVCPVTVAVCPVTVALCHVTVTVLRVCSVPNPTSSNVNPNPNP